MVTKRRNRQLGVTLMEVVLAVGLFSVVIGVSAQSLASFYVTMDVQEQRIEAIQSCRAVMNAIREKRTEYELPEDAYDWEGLLGWLDNQNEYGWGEFVRYGYRQEELAYHALAVQAYNMDGDPATAGDNPLQLIVTASWMDRKGRPMEAKLVGAVTSR